jgi:hypothetical protein
MNDEEVFMSGLHSFWDRRIYRARISHLRIRAPQYSW